MVELVWSEPYSFKRLLLDEPSLRHQWDHAGVYLHLRAPLATGKLLYVGKSTSSLWSRQVEHYLGQIGGRYRVPQGEVSGIEEEWRCEYGKKVSAEALGRVMNTLFDPEAFLRVVRGGMRFAQSHLIFLAKTERDQAALVEEKLQHQLNPTMTGSKTTDERPELQLRHQNAIWNTWPIAEHFRVAIH